MTKSRKSCALWRSDGRGTTAIEFSLLAVPFTFFVIGIIELSLLFSAGSLLEGATTDAARLIRTGQLQQMAEDPEEAFREALCNEADILMNCDNIQFQVTTLPSFADAGDVEETPEFDDEGNLVEAPFELGNVNDIVMIRVLYLYPMLTPGIGRFFSDYADNRKILSSSIVLQTEPYDFEDEGP